MKSKTSYFSRTLFLNTLKRFWPLFAAYPLVWLLAVPLSLNANLRWVTEVDSDLVFSLASSVMTTAAYAGPFICAGFAVLFAMASFNCFYNSRSVSMVCSLPVKREGLFLSLFTPGLFVMLFSNLLVFGTTLAVISSHGISITASYGVNLTSYLLQCLAIVSLQAVFFSGFAALCAMLTGHILVLPLVYVLLNFAVVVVFSVIYGILGHFVFGMNTGNYIGLGIATVFSPLFHMLASGGVEGIWQAHGQNNAVLTGFEYTGWNYLIGCAVVGLLFALLAMLLLKRRRMEASGDVVAIRLLKPVFKYCLCIGCALVIGLLSYVSFFADRTQASGNLSSALTLLGCMVIGAFIGYFAAEMLIRKAFRVFAPHKWIGLGISVFALAAFILSCEFDLTGFEKRVPSANQVESIDFNTAGYFSVLESPEDVEKIIELHSSIVSHKDMYEANIDGGNAYTALHLNYRLRDGSTLTRDYNITSVPGDDLEQLSGILNSPGVILKRNAPDFPVTENSVSDAYVSYFDPADKTYKDRSIRNSVAFELYRDCILPDLKAGTAGLVSILPENDGLDDFLLACSVTIEFAHKTETGAYSYQRISVTPTLDSLNFNKWLKENGIELYTVKEASEAYPYASDKPAETVMKSAY